MVRSVLGKKGIDLVQEMKAVTKAANYEVKPYVHISAILFVCNIMVYSLTTIFIHIYSAWQINKAVHLCKSLERGNRGRLLKQKPVKTSLLVKHTLIATLMCIALSFFVFSVEILTNELISCTAVCQAFLLMFYSLLVFFIVLFVS